ncbi:MAG: hypothetical protein HRT95_08985 [Moritella sp.]|uniref:hypothetical protein n=1 Tax=Moritella sp. TaxID=78556 RepID=UPI001DC1A367|nr:hypothetical protein [Moritella sp.]NQZ50302.1 hypothetical protein [Moritella sp.]
MTTLPALGPLLAGLLSKASVAVKFVIQQLPTIIEKIKPVVDVVMDIAKSLDMLSKYHSATELGDVILQAQNDGVTLDSCNGDVEKYHQKIDKVDLSQEKTALFSDNEKLSAGLLFIVAKLETQLGADVGQLIPLIYRNADFFNADRLSAYVVASTKSDISIGQICDYFSSNLDRKEAINVEGFLVGIESGLVVSKDIESVISTVKNARE